MELPKEWQEFDLEYRVATKAALEASKKYYEQAEQNGHPHVEVMKELGFEFGDEVKVPTMTELVGKLNGKFDQMIEDGELTEQDVLRPARVYKKTDGTRVAIPFGEEVPNGAVPETGVIELGFVLDMMKEGHFILGDNQTFNSPDVMKPLLTVFLHDMGHWTAFAQSPKYMKAVRALAAQMSEQGVNWTDTPDLARRFTFALEQIAVIDPKHRPQLLETFGLADKNYDATTIEILLKNTSISKLRKLAQTTIDLRKRVDGPFGGSSRDLVQNPIRFEHESDGGVANVYGHWWTTDYMAYELQKLLDEDAPRAEVASKLAQLQAAMLAATEIAVDDLVLSLGNDAVGKDSPLHAYYVASQGFDLDHEVAKCIFGDAVGSEHRYEFRG